MVLGHLAVADLARRTVFRDGNFIFMAAAAYGPDLLDKTARAFGGFGRGPGHSLLVFCLLAGLAWPFCRGSAARRRLFLIGAALWLSHLACDWPVPEVLFWPFLGSLPGNNPASMPETVVMFYQGKLSIPILIGEIVLVGASLCWRLLDFWRARTALAPGQPAR